MDKSFPSGSEKDPADHIIPVAYGESQNEAMILSVIIVHYKTVELTLRCIESIYRNAPDFPFEIILIDNGSNDGIGDIVSARHPAVHFIEMGENTGFTRANNFGMFNSHGRYVLLLNSDTQFVEPILDEMIHYMDSNMLIGASGPAHIDGSDKYQISFGSFPTLKNEILRKIFNYRVSLNDLHVREYLETAITARMDWLSGSCLLLRRSALCVTGLFDEAFFMYFEDVDLCMRLHRAGWEVHCLPHLKIKHYGGQSVKRNLLQGLVEYRRSQLYFAEKYYGIAGAVTVRSLFILKFGWYACRWVFPWCADLLRGRKGKPYTMLLFAKKVLQQALSRNRHEKCERELPRANNLTGRRAFEKEEKTAIHRAKDYSRRR